MIQRWLCEPSTPHGGYRRSDVKIFRVVNFRGSFEPRNSLTVDSWLHNRRAPGAFPSSVSREPAIAGRNAVANSSRRSIGRLPREVWTCAHAYSLNIAE